VDITQRKRAEDHLQRAIEDLQRSNIELEQFAYVASHDLQEPLRMVTSYMGLLEKRYKANLDEDAQEFIYYAVDGATRMQRLIQDLLAFSRVGTRGKALQPVDSDEVLAKALRNLEIAIEETQADIKSGKLPAVMADEDQLIQVFQNLIGNAIKFRGEKTPRVKIDAAEENGVATFKVRDNGIGFDQQHAERMFVIFQRLNNRAEYEGTGVGLAICKKVVERHGGKIWAESQLGKGATFIFTLNLAPEMREAEIEETAPEEETIKERAERLI
jgi:light-regulated signal transduction histidine kinase (bacteriophytochrome)